MKKYLPLKCIIVAVISIFFLHPFLYSKTNLILQDDPAPPSKPVRLVFIHHSTGGNWLADSWGGLGKALKQNNYYVSDVCYGWGQNSIGDRTDIGNWWEWFRDSVNSPAYLNDLYHLDAMDGSYGNYERLANNPDPQGENVIVMFKSCFPNSRILGNPGDPVPAIADNPMKGESAGSDTYTVANAKGIYIDLLEYFKTKLDKLFIVITAPPLIDPTYGNNARALNNWLVNNWLKNYPHNNVFVFDFFNCLTSNGGSADVNDLNQESGNHHRWWKAAIQHIVSTNNNFEAYPSGDDHPNATGNAKTTGEYLPLLNVAYNRWLSTKPTSIDDGNAEVTEPIFSISPVPVKDISVLGYELPGTSFLNIEIYNSLGIKFYNFSTNNLPTKGSLDLNLSSFNNGKYFIKISTKWGIYIVPVMVLK
ncbi:MAG: hypothetical protein ABSG15_07365 [FCB group bacterium]